MATPNPPLSRSTVALLTVSAGRGQAGGGTHQRTVMAKDIENVAQKLYDCFNKRNWSVIPDFTASNFVLYDMASGRQFRGHEGMRQWLTEWSTICSDMRTDQTVVIASSDTYVTIEGKAHGRNDGPITTPQGALPATGKPLSVQWVDLCQVQSGKITQIRCYYDALSIMNQLGFAPQPGARPPSTVVAH